MDVLHRMYAHLYWADRAMLESLGKSPSLPPQALELYAHILAAEHLWHARIKAQPPTHPIWPKFNLEQCAALAAQNQSAFQEVLASATESALSAEIFYTNLAGHDCRSRLDDILMHVAMHGVYHRGQVALVLPQGGGAPPRTDYILYTRDVADSK